jgi:hypothetical protein
MAMLPEGPFHPLSSAEWQLGGYPYGLEVIRLPSTLTPPGQQDLAALHDLDVMHRAWLAKDKSHVSMQVHASGADDPDRLFWFRWMISHQITFVVWQLLGVELRREGNGERIGHRMGRLMRAYSLMLIYSATPPRRIYNPTIRAVMARQHRHLSGAWARDLTDVRSVIRNRSRVRHEALTRECELNGVVHECIVEKLTPGEPSLLQLAKQTGTPRNWRSEALLDLYDSIFLTTRGGTSYPEVVAQLLRRLQDVELDLLANSMYPEHANSAAEEPLRMQHSDVAELKAAAIEILHDLAFIAVAAPHESGELT